MKWNEERAARAALTWVFEGGDRNSSELIASHGAAEVLAALRESNRESALSYRAKEVDLDGLKKQADHHQIRFLIPGDDQWPDQLDDLGRIPDQGGVPFGLWVRGPGELTDWVARSVAFVGSRAATHYGELAAQQLSEELCPQWTIISGGAYGIDAASHRAALAAGGRTIGVYANGLDICYPRGNQRLFETLCAEQLAISEVAPGLAPRRHGFLQRNRLIATLSQGTVIVEAALRSGARNTAAWALLLNRVLMGVPGSILSATSAGVNNLIHDGDAVAVTTAGQIRELLAPIGENLQPALDEASDQLCAALTSLTWRTVDEIALLSGLPIGQCYGLLAQLDSAEVAEHDGTGRWRLALAARMAA